MIDVDTDPTAVHLREAVWADPVPDAPRMVYADYLLERGDPLGELIALQLERARTGGPITERELAVREPHGRRAAQPLELFLLRFTLRRGFVDTGTPHPVLPAAIARHRAWATLERICVSTVSPLLDNPHLQPFALIAPEVVLQALAARTRPVAATELAEHHPDRGIRVTPAVLEAFDHAGGLAHVRTLVLDGATAWSQRHAFQHTQLGGQVDRLALMFETVERDRLEAWRGWISTTRLARVTFGVPLAREVPPGWELRLPEASRFLHVTIDRDDADTATIEVRTVIEQPHLAAAVAVISAVAGGVRRVRLFDRGAPGAKRQRWLYRTLHELFPEVDTTLP